MEYLSVKTLHWHCSWQKKRRIIRTDSKIGLQEETDVRKLIRKSSWLVDS